MEGKRFKGSFRNDPMSLMLGCSTGKIRICFLILVWIQIFGSMGCNTELPQRPAIQYYFSNDSFETISEANIPWSEKKNVKYNFGYFQRSVWVRFDVVNSEENPKIQYLEFESPWVDLVEVYRIEGNKIAKDKFQGSEPFSKKEFLHRHPVFRWELPPNSKTTTYVKIENSGILSAPIRVWDEVSFVERIEYDYLANGFYFGIMLGLLIYNIFIYINVRERAYLFYCLYLSSLILNYSLLGGFLKQYFFYEAEFSVKPALYVTVNSSLFFVTMFSFYFLNLKKQFKYLRITLLFSVWAFGIMTILSFFLPHNWIEMSFIYTFPYTVILLLFSGAYSNRTNKTSSRFFVVAWVVLFIGVIFDSLTKAGVLPSTTFGRYGVQIGTAFEVMLFSLALGRRIKKLSDENNKTQSQLSVIKKDLEIAKRIQLRILPATLPSDKHLSMEVTYLPLYEVGGDFYDFLEFTENDFGMVIADVTGHGVSAALDSSTVKIAFRNAREFRSSPKDIIASMNRFVCESLNQRFVSAAYFYLDFKRMQVTFTSAGNPPFVMIRDEQVRLIECSGLLLGVSSDFEYEQLTVDLKKGDRLLIFTDGLYENIHQDRIPSEILLEEIKPIAQFSKKEFHKSLIKRLGAMRTELKDDITLLTLDLL